MADGDKGQSLSRVVATFGLLHFNFEKCKLYYYRDGYTDRVLLHGQIISGNCTKQAIHLFLGTSRISHLQKVNIECHALEALLTPNKQV